MLSIAVCDDEPVFLTILVEHLTAEFQKYGIVCSFHTFTDSVACSRELQVGRRFDILFADIDMPGLNGIELGVQFRRELSDTILVYVSGREDLVFASFAAQPFRFICKRRLEETVQKLVPEILEEIEQRGKRKVAILSGGTTLLLRSEDILYVESFLKKQLIHTMAQERLETQMGFRNLLLQLSDHGFVQIHKSYAVNCRYIHTISRTKLELDDHTSLPIGRSYLPVVQERFRQYFL